MCILEAYHSPPIRKRLRSSGAAHMTGLDSDPPTSVIPERDPVQVIPGSVSIVPYDAMVGTQPLQSALVAEGKPSYASASNDDIFAEEIWERMDGPESHLGFALSGLAHLDRFAMPSSTPERRYLGLGSDGTTVSGLIDLNQSTTNSHKDRKISSSAQNHFSREKRQRATSPFSVTTRSSQDSGSPIVTMRFEHREDEKWSPRLDWARRYAHPLPRRAYSRPWCRSGSWRARGASRRSHNLRVARATSIRGRSPSKRINPVSISSRIAM